MKQHKVKIFELTSSSEKEVEKFLNDTMAGHIYADKYEITSVTQSSAYSPLSGNITLLTIILKEI